ncbi:fumarylacetoacetate hydrolase family protein, partial [bacterium]|nr:fumarylacetoacetate hydrolase family protein [bacterium]
MKLASLKSSSRDGELIIVSSDLKQTVKASHIVSSLREAIEEWNKYSPPLQQLSDALNSGSVEDTFPFDTKLFAAPMPRAFQWCDGSAYLHHAELVRKARGAELTPELYKEPMLYQGGSDYFLGPNDNIEAISESHGIDLEAEVAVVTGDVPMAASAVEAKKHIQLILLVNDVSLRNLIPQELAKGFGFFVSKPPTAFSPVAVTPDELGDAWDGGKVSLPIMSYINGKLLGKPHAGVDLYFDFPTLISYAASTRPLRAGTIIGSGTVSNRDLSTGSSCIQEKRMLEKIQFGEMRTPHLKFGDRVRIEMLNAKGDSVFGAIDQMIVKF